MTGLVLFTSDNDNSAIAGQFFYDCLIWFEVYPAAVIPVRILQPQQRQLQRESISESIAVPGLLAWSYVNSAYKFCSYSILGDLSIFQVQEHNVPVVVETPVQVETHRVS